MLLSLGSLQLYRLNWKLNLLSEIDSSLKNDPIEFSKVDKKNYLIKGWETIDLYGNRVRSNIIIKNINQELSDNIFNLNLYN